MKNENELDDKEEQTRNFKSIDADLDNSLDNNKKRANKRKNIESDTLESKYKAKSFLLNNSAKSNKFTMALPIKTERGVLVKNVREVDIVNDENQEEAESKVEAQVETKEAPIEKPKSWVEQLQEKHLFFNKTKDKIAHFSRDIIENPQGEVCFFS